MTARRDERIRSTPQGTEGAHTGAMSVVGGPESTADLDVVPRRRSRSLATGTAGA